MDSTYSTSSLVGLVSSKRRLHLPLFSSATPKFKADGLGVADVKVSVGLGRKPGRNASIMLLFLMSSATMARMKSGPGVVAVSFISRGSLLFIALAVRRSIFFRKRHHSTIKISEDAASVCSPGFSRERWVPTFHRFHLFTA